jgi:hypothetical protein
MELVSYSARDIKRLKDSRDEIHENHSRTTEEMKIF